MTEINYIILAKNFREYRDKLNYSDNFRLRIHRTLSWLKKAEETEELDSKFIFLWIAFNAAYAKDIENMNLSEREGFNNFLSTICKLDEDKKIYNIVWEKYPQSIRLLIHNPFVSKAFWDFHNLLISADSYSKQENDEKKHFNDALCKQKTDIILSILFKRLYTLRNQLVHGGATFNSSVNRDQLRDGCNILSFLLPVILDIMLKNHAEVDWGKPFYPVVKT